MKITKCYRGIHDQLKNYIVSKIESDETLSEIDKWTVAQQLNETLHRLNPPFTDPSTPSSEKSYIGPVFFYKKDAVNPQSGLYDVNHEFVVTVPSSTDGDPIPIYPVTLLIGTANEIKDYIKSDNYTLPATSNIPDIDTQINNIEAPGEHTSYGVVFYMQQHETADETADKTIVQVKRVFVCISNHPDPVSVKLVEHLRASYKN